MRVMKNTLEPVVEIEEDAGRYPNSLAQFPLPPRKFIAGVDGELVIELDDEELAEYREDPEEFLSNLDFRNPEGVFSMTLVVDKLVVGSPNLMVIHGENVEDDPDYGVEDGPEYDPVEEYERQRLEELD